ncbi:carbonic anhydrase [Kalamiella sp. sgz302252]|uniref:carbonic anhydrase n=1 Tax=Pantoea sp. sgz302252 TaxID=3341827 RepID=UPI0036D2DCB6
MLNALMARNRSWVQQQKSRDPHYFINHVSGQQPQALWIGCSDSRVPAEVLTCAHPGELFVHRNIASMVLEDDESLMSVLQYALQELGISTVILCGHYGCGGVLAALERQQRQTLPAEDPLSRKLQRLYQSLKRYMNLYQPDKEITQTSARQIAEYHVMAQTLNLINCWPIKEAQRQGKEIAIFGCIYELHSGRLKKLV